MELADGRTLDVYDSGGNGDVLVWHHGSPHTGAQLPPLLEMTRGLRLVTYARPSYGGSTPQPGRDVAAAAADVAAIADALGIERFATFGASGGGPHALACAALLPDRVSAVATLAGVAPLTDEFDWWAGMVDPGGLRAATSGRDARAKCAETERFDENSFTAADWAALEVRWAALGQDAGAAFNAGLDGLVDDDVAFAKPWGIDVHAIETRALIVQGADDRVIPPAHAHWLYRALPHAELWLRKGDGHVSVLDACALVIDWLKTS